MATVVWSSAECFPSWVRVLAILLSFVSSAVLILLLGCVFNFPTPISDVNMPQKREHADKFILLVGPTLQALPTKFPFWLCVVCPYIIQSWGKGRIYQAGRCRKLAGVQLWSREGTEQPVPPVSAFFLIRD